MTKSRAVSHKKAQRSESGASRRKAAVAVGLICVGVVAAVVAMNSDRLSVHSDVSEPASPPVEAAAGANTAPVILSVTPATDRIAPFDLCKVACEAEDADGDVLTYTWVASQGDVFGEGAAVDWGAPNSEGMFSLSVSVDDGRGGVAEASASLHVKANNPPAIASMSAFSDWIIPGASTYVSCVASDHDGDAITYEWVITAGETFGEGHSVVWVSPMEPGSYWVTVFARDAYGGEARRGIPISVTPSQPPTLGKFLVKGIDSDLVKPFEDGWKVFRGTSIRVECVVVDGDGPYVYSWTADTGTLTPDGAAAQWSAPNARGPATILVDVTDIHGSTASGMVRISVETCTCSFK